MHLGRYRLLRELGVGGMAEVYLARDTVLGGTDRLLVIKRILPSLTSDEQFVRMFVNEARISTKLNHPNIAHVYDAGRIGESYFLAMEHVHGKDLRAVLARSQAPLPPPLVAMIGARVASALHHAHQLKSLHGDPLGIVHRDISPHNICISFEGVVKVLDFGIAKATADDTQSGVLKGKYGYLSPEQATGAPLDGRSDIFSLGIVLFESLTHRRLFKRRSVPETVKAITSDRVTSPSAIAGRPIPRELERIVMKALDRDRMERYQTAREMQQDLEAVLRTSPASEMDLERFMRELFADEADVSLVDVAGTQEVTVPLPGSADATDTKPEPPGLDDEDSSTTMGGSAAEVAASPAPPPTQHLLVLKVIGALLGAAILVTLIATWGIDTDERRPPPREAPARITQVPDAEPVALAQPDLGHTALVIKTTPSGATVLVDGRLHPSKTPAVIRLPLSRRTVRLRLALRGHRAREIRFPVRPGQVTERHFLLRPIRVPDQQVTPPDAGSGPLDSATVSTAVPDTRVHEVRHGHLTINSDPWSDVAVDGRKVGVTPIVRLRLTAGWHVVLLENRRMGLRRFLRVKIVGGKLVRKMVKLVK